MSDYMTNEIQELWQYEESLIGDVLALTSDDEFLANVLAGSLAVAKDEANPIRGNLVASALREAMGHLLHKLAPDDDVRRCIWFKQAPDTDGVTRRQRATYIVQAGLPDHFVKDTLKVDVGSLVKALLAAMDNLNKATHVRPDTIMFDEQSVRDMMEDALLGLHDLLETAAASREDIKRAVEGVMHDAVFEKVISETIQELDELSTHTRVEGHFIDSVEVRRMDGTHLDYVITGEVEVELQYGSDSDVDNDIGFSQDDSYPYRAKVSSNVADPMDISSDDVDLKVDNSRFYE